MLNTNWTRMLTVCVLALALLLPTAAFAQGGHGGHETGDDGQMSEETAQMMESIEELRQLSGREFEIGYVNRIIPHHEGALEMAEMVVDDAPHKEVRDAAARIIEDQEREIEMLTGFLRDTYGVELDRDERQLMSEDMMGMIEDAEPQMGEQMFLLMMREHHQTAIEMGEIVLERAESEELLEQAREMIRSQREEQEQFAEWLQEWYGIEAPEPTGDMMAADHAMGTGMPNAGAGGMSRGTEDNASVLVAAVLGLLVLMTGGYMLRRRAA